MLGNRAETLAQVAVACMLPVLVGLAFRSATAALVAELVRQVS